MSTPSDKLCETCGRHFAWRAKWARDWENVRYCSKACRGGPGRTGRALEEQIVALLQARSAGASICPSEAAREFFGEDHWRAEMETVRQAARRLAHRGSLEITQAGHAVDPSTFRGPIRLRLPRD